MTDTTHKIYINRAHVFNEGVTWTTIAGLYPHAYVPEDALTALQAERDAWKARAEAAEAKLAEAVKALELADRNLTSLQPKIANGLVQDSWVPVFDAYIDPVIESSRAILAKLKGNNND